MRRTDDRKVARHAEKFREVNVAGHRVITANVHLTSYFVRIFVDVTFMTADKLLHKFDVFRNSDVRLY